MSALRTWKTMRRPDPLEKGRILRAWLERVHNLPTSVTRLEAFGKLVLWEGAQDILFELLAD